MTISNQAVRFHQYGNQQVVKIEDVAIPEATGSQVVVRVISAGVNPVDMKVRSGFLSEFFPLKFPVTSGSEFMGIVDSVPAGLTTFQIGDRVMGLTGNHGAFAQFILVESAQLVRVPAGVTDETASALPVSGTTAWQGLFEQGQLKAGQRVLIHGAAGGVGALAVQLAHQAGAEVIATASAKNHDYLSHLGANKVIDYHHPQEFASIKNVDLLLDLAGAGYENLSPMLKPLARVVSAVRPDIAALISTASEPVFLQMHPDNALLETLVQQLADGLLMLKIGKVYEFAQAAEAIEQQHGGVTGRAILKIGNAN